MDSSLPKTQCIIYYKVIWQISKFSDQSPSARGILSLHVQETPPMNTYQPAFLARILKESLVSSINTLIVVYQFSSVESLSRVWLFATPWTAARQASLSITNSRSLPRLMSIESVIPSNHLILCCPFLLLPSIFPSIRVFSNESALRIKWPKYWSFSISISNEY